MLMNTKIFFAYEGRIPSVILRELAQMGADCRKVEYDDFLKEEFCYLKVKTKQHLIRVMQYFKNLNDFHFKYYHPVNDNFRTVVVN